MVSQKELQQFKKIYFKKFGERISNQEALELGTKLINLLRVVYKTNNYYEKLKKKIQ